MAREFLYSSKFYVVVNITFSDFTTLDADLTTLDAGFFIGNHIACSFRQVGRAKV